MKRRELMKMSSVAGVSVVFAGCVDNSDDDRADEIQDSIDKQLEENGGYVDKTDEEFKRDEIDLSSPETLIESFSSLNHHLYYETLSSEDAYSMLEEMYHSRSPLLEPLEEEGEHGLTRFDATDSYSGISLAEEDVTVDEIEDEILRAILGDIEEKDLELAASLDNALVEAVLEGEELKHLTVQPNDDWLLFL